MGSGSPYARGVFERFGDGARHVVVLAQEEARLLQHNYIGTEHILLGLLHEGQGVAARTLDSLGVSLAAARSQVEEIIGRPAAATPVGHIPFTPRAKKVLELSLREALQLGHDYIGTEHILLGVLREGEGVATQVLLRLGADLAGVRERVIELLAGGSPAARSLISPPVVTASVAAGRCGMCGRDLWEVDRFVSGDATAICDLCIAAAQRALGEAPAEAGRDVPMPPRVLGPDPDDPRAAREIEVAFRTAFGGPIGRNVDSDPNTSPREDAERLAPFIAQAAERHATIQITRARVGRIRFVDPDEAEVQYSIQLAHMNQAVGFEGRAVRRDGRWLVSRDTTVHHLAMAGIQVPPPE
jgi:hypothetical protein